MLNRTRSAAWFVVAASLLVGSPSRAAPPKIPVVLSTDVGNEVDDQWAIVYLLINSKFDVRGIISAHAPTISPPAGQTSYRILLDVVENRLGMRSHPPLFAGADLPLEDRIKPRPSDGANFLIEASRQFSVDNRLKVLTIGAVTDAASAILIDPTIVERIEIIDMGFTSWPNGGDEFNIANDVKGMQVILDSEVPLTIGSGNVCRASLSMHLDQAREMLSGPGPVGEWLFEEFQAWYYRFVKPRRVGRLFEALDHLGQHHPGLRIGDDDPRNVRPAEVERRHELRACRKRSHDQLDHRCRREAHVGRFSGKTRRLSAHPRRRTAQRPELFCFFPELLGVPSANIAAEGYHGCLRRQELNGAPSSSSHL